jgi:hypothetical protein
MSIYESGGRGGKPREHRERGDVFERLLYGEGGESVHELAYARLAARGGLVLNFSLPRDEFRQSLDERGLDKDAKAFAMILFAIAQLQERL